jgi:hypothetical protein
MLPDALMRSEAQPARFDEATSVLAWDTCLADEDWTSSITEHGEQALIASAAALAAIELYATRRRNAHRVTPDFNHRGLDGGFCGGLRDRPLRQRRAGRPALAARGDE